MNALKSLNKEQWTALTAVVLGALMIFSGGRAGSGSSSDLPDLTPNRVPEPVAVRSADLPDEKFDVYWKGRDIFRQEVSSKLAVPPIKAPEPREEDLPAFPFRPSPGFEVYNPLPLTGKYPALTPGQPLVAEANLPPAAELEALRKTEEPAPAVRADRRLEREREFLIIQLNSPIKMEGLELLFESAEDFIFRNKNKQRITLKKSEIRSVLYNRTFQEEYKLRTAKIGPGPKEAEERVKLGRQLLDWGMIPEAKTELRDALEVKKDTLDAALLLGQLAQEDADFESALAIYQAALDAGASPAELHYEIGRCLKALALHEGAVAAFEKAVEAQTRHHKARLALARSQLDAGMSKASVESVNDFFSKLGTSPDTLPAHRAEGHLVRGLALVREGQLEKARADLGEALKLEANLPEAMNALGAIYAVEGKYPQAAPEFVKALRANPYLTEAWTNLATLYLLGGKWAEAESLFAAAQQRDPASVEAALGAGLAQFLSGKKEAPKTLERAAAMDPKNLLVMIAMGHVKLREGADEEALARFTEALRAEFHYLPAYSGAAAAYLRTARKLAPESGGDEGRLRKVQELRVNAETLIRALRDFDPNRAGNWALLGSCYAVTGRNDEARQALRMAANLSAQSQKAADPFVIYTAGYLEYFHGADTDEVRLDLAQREFAQGVKLKGQLTDAYSMRVIADCEAMVDAIENWKITSVRFDERFEGDTAKSIGGGWIEADNVNGISITREYSKDRGGRAKFAGMQVGRDWAMTSLAKDIPGQGFHSLEITLQPGKVDKAEYGVSIYYAQQGESNWTGFHIGFAADGKVRYQPHGSDRDMDGRDMSVGWMDVRVPLPNPKEIILRLSLGEKARATSLTLSFWNAAKGEWTPAQKDIPVNLGAGRGNWRVAAWTRAWKGQEVLLHVDNFRVFERARRNP